MPQPHPYSTSQKTSKFGQKHLAHSKAQTHLPTLDQIHRQDYHCVMNKENNPFHSNSIEFETRKPRNSQQENRALEKTSYRNLDRHAKPYLNLDLRGKSLTSQGEKEDSEELIMDTYRGESMSRKDILRCLEKECSENESGSISLARGVCLEDTEGDDEGSFFNYQSNLLRDLSPINSPKTSQETSFESWALLKVFDVNQASRESQVSGGPSAGHDLNQAFDGSQFLPRMTLTNENGSKDISTDFSIEIGEEANKARIQGSDDCNLQIDDMILTGLEENELTKSA